MNWYKISQSKTLNLSPFIAGEIAIEFENYDEHYEDPSDPNIQAEKSIYEKLKNGNFSFTNEELLMIGQAVLDIESKDLFEDVASNKKQLFNVEFQLGMLKPISDEVAMQAVKNGYGVKMSHFPKINGQRYEYNDNWRNNFGG